MYLLVNPYVPVCLIYKSLEIRKGWKYLLPAVASRERSTDDEQGTKCIFKIQIVFYIKNLKNFVFLNLN